MQKRLTSLFVALFALTACRPDTTVGPPASVQLPNAVTSIADAVQPVSSPFLLEFNDVNPCTGAVQHFVFEGIARLQSFGDHSVLHIAGTVTTSDGWIGKFNRQLVTQGGELTWRFTDMEVGPEHARQLFTGVLKGTMVNGQPVFTFSNQSLRCVGKPTA